MQLIRSRRRTIAVQIAPDGGVIVRAPLRLSDAAIERFLQEKRNWIATRSAQAKQQWQTARQEPLSPVAIRALAEEALQAIPPLVAQYAAQMDVTYGRITIRCQKTRWGSCSSKGNLNFNCLLMLAPPEVRSYVVVHELAHRKQMNHSAAFWREVEKLDYAQARAWLRQNGRALLSRVE